MRRSSPRALLCYLLISAVAVNLTGLVLQRTVCRATGQLQDKLPVAVPFLLLQDPTLLQVGKAGENGGPKAPPPGGADSQGPAQQEGDAGSDSSQLQPAPSPFHQVEPSYFDDALFIGDSRTEGLWEYGRLGAADYFCGSGMTVFNVFEQQSYVDSAGGRTDLLSLLAARTYGKVYLMLGINELGYDFDRLMERYQALLGEVRRLQPSAKVFLCGNLHVSREKVQRVQWLHPSNIENLNAHIAALADGQQVFYLDVNPEFCDGEGYLRPELTGDGTHPFAAIYQVWAQWLCKNGV
ncbi:hypothetical protein H8K20_07395 [Neobittarella massiliensis]|uniref:SGNH hydrolase-type esterase domain-containing protein n=1 Tax=Neobittarella massiliensis (ex Bilen et al. 2018) TaxID=2041842 RepID=A0A8J6IQG7_9FIRM|nr:GDSL-type esterase/lipase family protein [Neobittarella massiliensis]MBC3516218.1 hypothetical protein [Neobittarella massiliensis]